VAPCWGHNLVTLRVRCRRCRRQLMARVRREAHRDGTVRFSGEARADEQRPAAEAGPRGVERSMQSSGGSMAEGGSEEEGRMSDGMDGSGPDAPGIGKIDSSEDFDNLYPPEFRRGAAD
jgi:hypothetical protein